MGLKADVFCSTLSPFPLPLRSFAYSGPTMMRKQVPVYLMTCRRTSYVYIGA